jgi:hypothetical protein
MLLECSLCDGMLQDIHSARKQVKKTCTYGGQIEFSQFAFDPSIVAATGKLPFQPVRLSSFLLYSQYQSTCQGWAAFCCEANQIRGPEPLDLTSCQRWGSLMLLQGQSVGEATASKVLPTSSFRI